MMPRLVSQQLSCELNSTAGCCFRLVSQQLMTRCSSSDLSSAVKLPVLPAIQHWQKRSTSGTGVSVTSKNYMHAFFFVKSTILQKRQNGQSVYRYHGWSHRRPNPDPIETPSPPLCSLPQQSDSSYSTCTNTNSSSTSQQCTSTAAAARMPLNSTVQRHNSVLQKHNSNYSPCSNNTTLSSEILRLYFSSEDDVVLWRRRWCLLRFFKRTSLHVSQITFVGTL